MNNTKSLISFSICLIIPFLAISQSTEISNSIAKINQVLGQNATVQSSFSVEIRTIYSLKLYNNKLGVKESITSSYDKEVKEYFIPLYDISRHNILTSSSNDIINISYANSSNYIKYNLSSSSGITDGLESGINLYLDNISYEDLNLLMNYFDNLFSNIRNSPLANNQPEPSNIENNYTTDYSGNYDNNYNEYSYDREEEKKGGQTNSHDQNDYYPDNNNDQNFTDVIVLKTGEEINANITEVSSGYVKYKNAYDSDGHTNWINKNDIFMVKYKDGSKDVFKDNDKNEIAYTDTYNARNQEQSSYSSDKSSNNTNYENKSSKKTEDENKSKSKKTNFGNNYFGSVSAGYGSNHGGLGVKALFGSRNWDGDNGVFLSVGTFSSEVLWEVGIQGSTNGVYFILSGGGIAVETVTVTSSTGYYSYSQEVIYGITGTGGYRISLGSAKRMFIDLGIGYSYGEEMGFLAFDAAFGIRF